MSAQPTEPLDAPEHPSKPNGEPYGFGGYAFLKLGCRCAGCMDAQQATARNAAGKRKRASTAGQNLRSAPNPVAAVLTDVAGEAQAKPKAAKGGAPLPKIEQAAAQLLVYLSLGYIMAAGRGLPLSDEQTDALALSDDEAGAIAAPLARVFAGSELNSRYGRSITENLDVLEAVFTAGAYVRRTTKTLTEIRQAVAGRTPGPAPHPNPTGGPHAAGPAAAPVQPAQQPDRGRGAEPEAEPAPPRPSYAPYEPGSQLSADL